MGQGCDCSGSAIGQLLRGAVRFGEAVFPPSATSFATLARGQSPRTLFIACADSRVSPELITGTGPGDMFVLRNIGNIVPSHGAMPEGASAVVEYAVAVLGVSDIVVCGHTDCGAMKALADPEAHRLDELPAVKSWLGHVAAARRVADARRPGDLRVLIEQNVLLQMAHLRTHPAVAARLEAGDLHLHGWVYDIEHGGIDVLDEATREAVGAAEALARLRARPAEGFGA